MEHLNRVSIENSAGLGLDGVKLNPKKRRSRIKPLLYRSDTGITLEGLEDRKRVKVVNPVVMDEPKGNWVKKGGKGLFDTMREMESRGELDHPMLKGIDTFGNGGGLK